MVRTGRLLGALALLCGMVTLLGVAPAQAAGRVSVANEFGSATIDGTYSTTLTLRGSGFQSVKGGHGGRSLLEHSLLVAFQMQNLAMKWTYTGLRDRSGKRVSLKLRDDNYKFDPMDPIVLIVGLAHDIGKIEAYLYDDTGEIVGSHHEHDLTGARMIARMPEMWDLPEADRQAMLLAYAAGAVATGLGIATGVAVVLALGAALLNLGTVYRVLVIALDHRHLDVPVVELGRGLLVSSA